MEITQRGYMPTKQELKNNKKACSFLRAFLCVKIENKTTYPQLTVANGCIVMYTNYVSAENNKQRSYNLFT